jgi:hypothetical protein
MNLVSEAGLGCNSIFDPPGSLPQNLVGESELNEFELAEFSGLLKRNNELFALWVETARVVLRGEAQGLRALVDVMGPRAFQEQIFRFFCPPTCMRAMSDQVIQQMLPVIEDVVHSDHGENVAVIDPEVAQLAADLVWADGVEAAIERRRAESPRNETMLEEIENEAPADVTSLQRSDGEHAVSAEHVEDEAIWLLKYNRMKDQFHQALENAQELEPCREALGAIGKSWKAPWGGYILVHAHQYQEVLDKLNGRALKTSHVVVSATWESVLQGLVTAGVRHREIVGVPPAKVRKTETLQIAEVQERTFICWGAALRSADSVTKSTTDAHGGRLNPRRLQHLALSD